MDNPTISLEIEFEDTTSWVLGWDWDGKNEGPHTLSLDSLDLDPGLHVGYPSVNCGRRLEGQ